MLERTTRPTCRIGARLGWLSAIVMLAASAHAQGVQVPAGTSPFAPGMARPAGACRSDQICTFRNPEDLADLPGTPWLIVSQSGPDSLIALDSRTGRTTPLRIPADPAPCIAEAGGGGIGTRREGSGYRLVRILHHGHYSDAALDPSANDAVETFQVTIGRKGPQLRRTACVVAPAPLFLNDIAPLPGGGFVATHMFDRAGPAAARTARFLAGEPTGYVVRWSAAGGWVHIAGSEGVFPNGVDVTQDGTRIAYAETYGHRLVAMAPDGSDKRVIPLAMNPDNVIWNGGGRFLVAGGTGVPLTSTAGCGPYRQAGCAFPAGVVEVDVASGVATPLVTSGGAELPGFSVARMKAGRLYVGSSTGDRLTTFDARTLPATRP